MATLSDLGVLLSPAVVYGEVDPSSYEIYEGIKWSSGTPARFFDAFESAVRAIASDYKTIAISFSGGVDSAYCVHRLRQICEPERLIPIYFDAPTDAAFEYSTSARDALRVVAPGCRLEEIATGSTTSSRGVLPYLHSVPSAVAAIEKRARALGAEVLVTGCGADEIITPPKYLGIQFLKEAQFRKACARLSQAASLGLGAMLEEYVAPIAFGLPWLSSPRRKIEFAFEELHCPTPYDMLCEPLRGYAKAWTEKLYEELTEKCLCQSASLAEIDAFLSVFPLSRLGPITGDDLDVRHPFQEPEVVRHALQIPFEEKLGPATEPVYQRRKTLLYAAMSGTSRGCIPTTKIGYSGYLQDYCRYERSDHQRLQSIKFLCGEADFDRIDLSTKLVLGSIARWLDSADAGDYSPITSEDQGHGI